MMDERRDKIQRKREQSNKLNCVSVSFWCARIRGNWNFKHNWIPSIIVWCAQICISIFLNGVVALVVKKEIGHREILPSIFKSESIATVTRYENVEHKWTRNRFICLPIVKELHCHSCKSKTFNFSCSSTHLWYSRGNLAYTSSIDHSQAAAPFFPLHPLLPIFLAFSDHHSASSDLRSLTSDLCI